MFITLLGSLIGPSLLALFLTCEEDDWSTSVVLSVSVQAMQTCEIVSLHACMGVCGVCI